MGEELFSSQISLWPSSQIWSFWHSQQDLGKEKKRGVLGSSGVAKGPELAALISQADRPPRGPAA